VIGPISHFTALKKEMARVLDGYESVEDSEYVPYEQSDTAGIRHNHLRLKVGRMISESIHVEFGSGGCCVGFM